MRCPLGSQQLKEAHSVLVDALAGGKSDWERSPLLATFKNAGGEASLRPQILDIRNENSAFLDCATHTEVTTILGAC